MFLQNHNFALFRYIAAIFLLILSSAPTEASTISSVGSPNVSKGRLAAEARIGFSADNEATGEDSRLRSRLHIDYGLTDYYAPRLILLGDNRRGDNFEFDAVTFENRFHILKSDIYGFDFGMRAGYTLKDGDKKPDNFSLGFYELLSFNKWSLRLNQLFSHAVGEASEDGIEAESRIQVNYQLSKTFSLGLESFNDFGNLNEQDGFDAQAHSFGPVIKAKLPSGFAIETGYRAGYSKAAPDHNFKFFISRNF